MAADKMNFTIGNVVKRVYHTIREECKLLKISLKEQSDIIKAGKILIKFISCILNDI